MKQLMESIYGYKRTSTTFMDKDLAALTTTGQIIDHAEKPSTLKSIVRTGARSGVPILGSALDFGMQVQQGEDIGDAAIKTAGHAGAGAIGVSTGAIVGASFGSVIPVVGTIIGGAVGYGVGVAGAMAFDWLYDNKENIMNEVKESGERVVKNVGDAVASLFGKIGSAFD